MYIVQCYDRSYCILEFFFVRFLDFELLLILYYTVVNSDLGLTRLAEKQRSVANLFRLGCQT